MKELSAYIVFNKKSDIPQELIDFLNKKYYKKCQRWWKEPSENEPCVISTSWSNRSYSFVPGNSESFFNTDPHIGWTFHRTECKTVEEFKNLIIKAN